MEQSGHQGDRQDPENPSTLLVGTRYDLYISHDSGATWAICGFGNNSTDPSGGALHGINRISGIYLDSRGATTRAYVAVGYPYQYDNGGDGVFDNSDNGVYGFDVPSAGCPLWPGAFTTYFGGLPAGTGTAVGGSSTGRIELDGPWRAMAY